MPLVENRRKRGCLNKGTAFHCVFEGVWCARATGNLEVAAEKCHCYGSGVRFCWRGVALFCKGGRLYQSVLDERADVKFNI